jgi:hypothetical protein
MVQGTSENHVMYCYAMNAIPKRNISPACASLLPAVLMAFNVFQSAKRTVVEPRDEFDFIAEALMSPLMYLNGATIMRGMRWWVSIAD